MNLGKRLHARVGYDDVNEAFWSKKSIAKMLTMDAMGGASSTYARFRQFLRSAHASRDRDQRLAAVFEKTFREHYGWAMVFCNFHRMFTFLSLAFHVLVVHAFAGFSRPTLFFSAAVTAAACNSALEAHCLFVHRQELFWSRRASAVRLAVAAALMLGASFAFFGAVDAELFCVVACAPYLRLRVARDCRGVPAGGPRPRERFAREAFPRRFGRGRRAGRAVLPPVLAGDHARQALDGLRVHRARARDAEPGHHAD
jgi:hypothetical protein